MTSELEHVVEQIGVVVLKYINGIRDDSSEPDISQQYFSNLANLKKTYDFFSFNINDICEKSAKANRRRSHLEYLSSAYLYFREKLDPLSTFGISEQKNFQVLFVHFLSSVHALLNSPETRVLDKISDDLIDKLRADNSLKYKSNGGDITVESDGEQEVISMSQNTVTLSSFKYQQGTLHHYTAYSAISGTGIGTLGGHVNTYIFSLLEVPEKKDFLTQAIKYTSSHCATRNERYFNEVSELRESNDSLKTKLIELSGSYDFLKAELAEMKQLVGVYREEGVSSAKLQATETETIKGDIKALKIQPRLPFMSSLLMGGMSFHQPPSLANATDKEDVKDCTASQLNQL